MFLLTLAIYRYLHCIHFAKPNLPRSCCRLQKYYNFGSSEYCPFVGVICNPLNSTPDPEIKVFMCINKNPLNILQGLHLAARTRLTPTLSYLTSTSGIPYEFEYTCGVSQSTGSEYIACTTHIVQLYTENKNAVDFNKSIYFEKVLFPVY